MTYSLSSALLYGTTLFRNQEGTAEKCIAEVAYVVIEVVSVVEAVAAGFFTALSLVIYPFSEKAYVFCAKWLDSSAFSMGWALGCVFMNPFSDFMVLSEELPRRMLHELWVEVKVLCGINVTESGIY